MVAPPFRCEPTEGDVSIHRQASGNHKESASITGEGRQCPPPMQMDDQFRRWVEDNMCRSGGFALDATS